MQSRRHLLLWILLAMLLMGCSTQSPPNAVAASPTTPDNVEALSVRTVISRYYQDLKARKPELAYTYISLDARSKGQKVTRASFIQMAKKADQEFGPIKSFSSEPNGNDPSRVTMTITRTNNPRYHCHIQIKRGKIISFDVL